MIISPRDKRHTSRIAVLQAIIADTNMESDNDEEDLLIACADERFVAAQYSMQDKGDEWLTLGTSPTVLYASLADETGWYAPHSIWDLDTGRKLVIRTLYTLDRIEDTKYCAIANRSHEGHTDLERYYDLNQETDSQ